MICAWRVTASGSSLRGSNYGPMKARADISTGGPRAARSGGGRAAAEGRGAADDDADALALALDTLDTLDAAAAPPTAMRVRGGGCGASKGRVEQEAVASGTPGPDSPPGKQAQQGAQGEVCLRVLGVGRDGTAVRALGAGHVPVLH